MTNIKKVLFILLLSIPLLVYAEESETIFEPYDIVVSNENGTNAIDSNNNIVPLAFNSSYKVLNEILLDDLEYLVISYDSGELYVLKADTEIVNVLDLDGSSSKSKEESEDLIEETEIITDGTVSQTADSIDYEFSDFEIMVIIFGGSITLSLVAIVVKNIALKKNNSQELKVDNINN